MAYPGKRPTPHMLPALWGLDVAFAAACWALCGAQTMQITMVSKETILLFAMVAWVCTILSRTFAAILHHRGWCHHYYKKHAAPMLALSACVTAAGVWMLCYTVGRYVLPYTILPTLLLLPSATPTKKPSALKLFMRFLALGYACLIPAFSLNFELSPIDMLFRAPCWYIGILCFIFQQERSQWADEGNAPHRISGFLIAKLLFLLLFCSISISSHDYFDLRMSITIIMGELSLALLAILRPNLNEQSIFCLSWPIMALPALLGLLLF